MVLGHTEMLTDTPLWFVGLLLVAAIGSGAAASVVGFGIGSLLTPLFAVHFGTDVAIAAVALPHLAGGLLRGWRLRSSVDRSVLLRFGVLSAVGGLVGALSGFFGGVAGNQGGLRAAALSTFGLAPAAFVATSTVIGVFVDVARIPIYLYGAENRLAELWSLVALAAAGVLAGTLVGERLLFGLSPARFRVAVSAAIGLLGLWFLLGAA